MKNEEICPDLKRCPFCGLSELSQFAIKAGLDVAYVVNCKWCGGRAEGWTEEEAVLSWNSRSESCGQGPAFDETTERLKAMESWRDLYPEYPDIDVFTDGWLACARQKAEESK